MFRIKTDVINWSWHVIFVINTSWKLYQHRFVNTNFITKTLSSGMQILHINPRTDDLVILSLRVKVTSLGTLFVLLWRSGATFMRFYSRPTAKLIPTRVSCVIKFSFFLVSCFSYPAYQEFETNIHIFLLIYWLHFWKMCIVIVHKLVFPGSFFLGNTM